MTNELGTTLQELEDKAKKKSDAILELAFIEHALGDIPKDGMISSGLKIIRKYIEQS